jgi:arylsulfatase A-like enzyme
MRVIVFALHGCPAGWLGAYGNDWVGTPNLDRLAAEGVTFDRHISDCPEPGAAQRAWLGGEEPNPPTPFPGREGGENADPSPTPPPRGEGLQTEDRSLAPPSLPGKGVGGLGSSTHTILVRANHPDTDVPDWFYAGWDEVFDARPKAEDTSPLEELLRTFPAILNRLADKPDFLLWIETDRLIPPWDVQQDVFEAYLADIEDEEPAIEESEEEPDEDAEDDEGEMEDEDTDEDVEYVDGEEEEEPELPDAAIPEEEPVTPFADPPTGPFDRSDLDAWDWLHRTFAAVMTKFDAELGRLFDDLREHKLDQSAAWLVTSDFGYPLGEHGQVGLHRPWLHEELVHLPLILRLPGAEQAGRRVAGFTQPPDMFPTLLALLGVSPPAEGSGFNLLPLARGEGESAREFAVTTLELGDAAEIALRTHEYALLVPTRIPEGDSLREPLLYEKPDDRWEVNDLRPRNIERADELEAKLREEMQKRAAR